MKQLFTIRLSMLLLFCGWALQSTAQNKTSEPVDFISNPSAEIAPGVVLSHNNGPKPLALWDIQFSYNSTDSSGFTGQAGVCYTGTEFWVSKWASDTIFTFSSTGSCTDTFTIPTLSGVRAFTWDGTNIYAVNNTNLIYRLNPVNKTLVNTITVAMTQVRHCSYDPTANSGGGGFWIGNWATDLVQVDMTGNLLATIPAATHTLTSMYGSAYDGHTSGGPYLWIFHQGGASTSNIARVKLPAGNLTLAAHDVMTDAGPAVGATSGLAGGLFITDQLVVGQWTIGGILQGTPVNALFGYELNDFVPPAVDAIMDTFAMVPGYTQIPQGHASNLSFIGNVRNGGLNTLTTVNFNSKVMQGASTVYTNTQTTSNLASGANTNLTSGTFSAVSMGTYDCYGTVTLSGQTDLVPSNDSLTSSFEVTDSTYARDDGNSNGNAYNIGGTDWALATTNFTIPVADTLTSIWIRLETPVTGDTTYGVVAETNTGFPVAVIAQTPVTIIDGTETDYVLVFPNGVALGAGEYAIGVYEGANTSIGLAQSANVYTPGINFIYTPTSGWFASSIATSRFIRPNFGNVSFVGLTRPKGNLSLQVFPNPANQTVNLRSGENLTRVTVNSVTGQQMMVISPEGKEIAVDISSLAEGIYLLYAETENGTAVERLVVSK